MKQNTKKLLSFNLILIMMLSLLICPFFTQKVEAEEASQFEKVLIVDGIEYDASKNQAGEGWVYDTDSSNKILLNNYNGGAIYCSEKLVIYVEEDSVIESSEKAGIESLVSVAIMFDIHLEFARDLKVVTSNNYPAIKAPEVFIDSNIELFSDNNEAIDSDRIYISADEYSKVYIGKSKEDSRELGQFERYQGESYLKYDYIDCILKLYGNGGKTATNETEKEIIHNVCSYPETYFTNLYKYSNLFSNEDRVLLGWSEEEEVNDYSKIYNLNSDIVYYNGSSLNFTEKKLYAVWSDEKIKGIKLCDIPYMVEFSTVEYVDKVIVSEKGKKCVLPNVKYAGHEFMGWFDKDKNRLYKVGEEIVVNDNISLYAKFNTKKGLIGGEEIDLDKCIWGDGYQLTAKVDKIEIYLRKEYNGEIISMPDDVIIKPSQDCKIVSNIDKPCINVEGNIDVHKQYLGDKLELISTTSAPAIQATGDINILKGLFYVGNDVDNVRVATKYNGERYLKIDNNDKYEVTLKDECIIPDYPEKLKYDNSELLGLTDKLDIIYEIGCCDWYMPGQKVNFDESVTLYPIYVKPNGWALRFNGNGGVTDEGKELSVCYFGETYPPIIELFDFDYSRDGYELLGWGTEPDGTGMNYTVNYSSLFYGRHNMIGVVDLYAIWQESSSTTGGGINPEEPEEPQEPQEPQEPLSYVPVSNNNSVVDITNNSDDVINVNYKLKNDDNEVIDVKLNRREENNIIRNILENKTNNIVFNLEGDFTSIKFNLSKRLADSLESKCSVTINSNIANVIIPNKALKINKDGMKLGINKENDKLIKIEKNFNYSVKVRLPKNSDKVVSMINGDKHIIISKSIEKDKNIEFIVTDKNITLEIVKNNVQFEDNKDEEQWYYNAVQFVGERDLFEVKDNKFEPNVAVKRLDLVSILHKLESKPEAKECKFKDVKPEDKFAEAVAWASDNNIVKGTLKGFEPNKNITREQLCVMIYNYAKYLGLDTNIENIELSFDDNDKVASWSKDAVKWMVENELLKGSYNKINPRGNATNAQLATIVERFVEMIVNGVE